MVCNSSLYLDLLRLMDTGSVRAVKVAIKCIKMALHNYGLQIAKPRVVLVSDTPSFIKDISPNLTKFADVLYFDYEMFKGSISNFSMNMKKQLKLFDDQYDLGS
ncbi:hypothetical protein HPP92_009880 [Vanilla planifolia]|uniref:Uncharacterized protein n=1 Tax=Vanilla planifolia TaxID=51239 RepID=A0A835V7E4_VANPL|nr:hypothetical protein HPP92_009880 [Vanilla planifolia]